MHNLYLNLSKNYDGELNNVLDSKFCPVRIIYIQHIVQYSAKGQSYHKYCKA